MGDIKRVLVADDSDTVTTVLATALELEGYEVDKVDNGIAAYEMGRVDRYDLIILDHLMPGLLGLEIMERWKAKGTRSRRSCSPVWTTIGSQSTPSRREQSISSGSHSASLSSWHASAPDCGTDCKCSTGLFQGRSIPQDPMNEASIGLIALAVVFNLAIVMLMTWSS